MDLALYTARFQNAPSIEARSWEMGREHFNELFPQLAGRFEHPRLMWLAADTARSGFDRDSDSRPMALHEESFDKEKARRATELFERIGTLLTQANVPFVVRSLGGMPCLWASIGEENHQEGASKTQNIPTLTELVTTALRVVEADYQAKPFPPLPAPEPAQHVMAARRGVEAPLRDAQRAINENFIRDALARAAQGYTISKEGLSPEAATANLIDDATRRIIGTFYRQDQGESRGSTNRLRP